MQVTNTTLQQKCWRIPGLFFIITLWIGLLAGCAKAETEEYTSLEQFKHATLGVVTGSSHVTELAEFFPEAKVEYFNAYPDLVQALKQNTIEGFVMDDAYIYYMLKEQPWLKTLPEAVSVTDYGYAFSPTSKGENLKAQMDEFLKQCAADGTLAELEAKWIRTDPKDIQIEDYEALPDVNGTVTIALDASMLPFTYLKDGSLVGFDLEMMKYFCEAHGYGIDLEEVAFASIVPGLSTSKYDIGISGITITKERAESVLFSEPYLSTDVVMAYKGTVEDVSFWDRMKEGFDKTFVREQRWKLIVRGVVSTLLITILAVIFGTLLGFGIYMACRTGNKIARRIAVVYGRIIAGTPIVVLLMVLFYIVFARVHLAGIWVAVIGFTLTMGAFVYRTLEVSVDGVDIGQTEAALALGYSKNRTFFKIVLPQSMNQFLPAYQGEVVTLIKETSVVGFIAVQDLTKMSDVIRSTTYEAFFPLISSACIYFVITWLFSLAVGAIKMKFEPQRRKNENLLKGVKR